MSAKQLTDVVYDFEGLYDLDFIPVVSVDLGISYEWDEFHAWFSPSRQMYFWGSGSGCSCNSFADGFRSIQDFENGRERSDVMAALNRYFDAQYENHPQERVAALYDVNSFRVPRADQ